MLGEILAIDPWALILPTRIYLIFVEKLHPHEPVLPRLTAAIKQMTPEEKEFVQARISRLTSYAGAVEKAMTGG